MMTMETFEVNNGVIRQIQLFLSVITIIAVVCVTIIVIIVKIADYFFTKTVKRHNSVPSIV